MVKSKWWGKPGGLWNLAVCPKPDEHRVE